MCHKNTKNIIEAGITDKEFARIVGHLDFKDGYLGLWPDQKERNYHLYELAELRGQHKLAEYFKKDSKIPTEYFLEGEQ